MGVTTTDDLKPGAGSNERTTADLINEGPVGQDGRKRKPKVSAGSSSAPNEETASTESALDAQDKVEVYVPRARGTQTVQINGVKFRVPAGVRVEVASDIAKMLKSSGALDLPPEV